MAGGGELDRLREGGNERGWAIRMGQLPRIVVSGGEWKRGRMTEGGMRDTCHVRLEWLRRESVKGSE